MAAKALAMLLLIVLIGYFLLFFYTELKVEYLEQKSHETQRAFQNAQNVLSKLRDANDLKQRYIFAANAVLISDFKNFLTNKPKRSEIPFNIIDSIERNAELASNYVMAELMSYAEAYAENAILTEELSDLEGKLDELAGSEFDSKGFIDWTNSIAEQGKCTAYFKVLKPFDELYAKALLCPVMFEKLKAKVKRYVAKLKEQMYLAETKEERIARALQLEALAELGIVKKAS